MTDIFAGYSATLDSPGQYHALVVASASPLNPKPRALYCEAGGSVTVEDEAGTSLVYTLTSGQVLPFRGHAVTALTGVVYAWW